MIIFGVNVLLSIFSCSSKSHLLPYLFCAILRYTPFSSGKWDNLSSISVHELRFGLSNLWGKPGVRLKTLKTSMSYITVHHINFRRRNMMSMICQKVQQAFWHQVQWGRNSWLKMRWWTIRASQMACQTRDRSILQKHSGTGEALFQWQDDLEEKHIHSKHL